MPISDIDAALNITIGPIPVSMIRSLTPRYFLTLLFFCSFAIPTTAQNRDEDLLFANAERFYTHGQEVQDRSEKAKYSQHVVGLYENFLTQFPNSRHAPLARFHLGHALQTLGQLDQAKANYRHVINKHLKGQWVGNAARQLAYLFYIEESWAEAAKYFGVAALHVTSQDLRFSALTKRVQCLLKINRTKEVVEVLRAIIAEPKHPYQEWAVFMLGYQYYLDEQLERSIKILKPLTKEAVQSIYRSQAMFYIGLASSELGLSDEATNNLHAVLKIRMNDPSLTNEQRLSLGTNKALAQTALMKVSLDEEDYQEVIKLYSMGDFGAKGKVEARRSMRAGRAFLALKKYQQARAAFRRVDRNLPNTELAFESAYLCLECDFLLKHNGLSERVDIFFELYGKKNPNDPRLHMANFLKAETLYQAGDFEKAGETFSLVETNLIKKEYRADLLYKRGWCLSEFGDFNGANRSYTRFLTDFPDDSRKAEILAKRAEALLALGDQISALKDFEELIGMKPEPILTAFAYQGSGRVLRKEKKYRTMVERYRQLLANFPDIAKNTVANANYWIGWGLYKENELDDVAPYLEKARDLAPEFYSEPVGNILVLSSFAQRDSKALHKAIQRIFQDAPGKEIPSHILSWLGVQLFHEGNIEGAVTYLEKSTDPENPAKTKPGVWRTLAKAQNESKNFAAALKTGRIILDLKQEKQWEADSMLDLALSQIGLAKYEEAIETANKALAIDVKGPHLAGLHLVKAEVALRQNRPEKALQDYQKTIQMILDDPLIKPRALAGAAQSAELLGEEERAAQYRLQLKQGFPNWNDDPIETKQPEKEGEE